MTTVPASAYFGGGDGPGEASEALGALLVLGINLVLLIVGGSITLYFQRLFTPPRDVNSRRLCAIGHVTDI